MAMHNHVISSILLLLCVGCSVNHQGLIPVVPGDRYRIACDYEYSYRLDTSNGILNGHRSTEVCSNGPPSRWNMEGVCLSLGYALQSDPAGLFDEITSFRNTRIHDPELLTTPCTISSHANPGDISHRTDSLGAIEPTSARQLLHNSDGSLIGNIDASVLKGTVSQASIVVGARFQKWRFARTSASGNVAFDGGDCAVNTVCELVLRHLELDINDFTIVRPTVFAKDVSFRNVKLYSINNYRTQRRGNGSFDISGIQIMVSGIQNGRRVSFQTTADVSVSGRFGHYLPGGSSAPQRISLRLRDLNQSFYIDANVDFRTDTTQARLKNHGTARCLRGSVQRSREIPATIESCRAKTQPQSIAIETRGNAYRFRNAATNSCLNLKTSQQNVEGGSVHWVNCSSHMDQLWFVRSNGQIVHKPSGRCLNVHRGRENRNGGRVTVYSCASTPDQRWSVVTPR